MATKSILLKVTPEVHAAIQEAAGRHQRSMQNVLVALIERWLEAGGPDPLVFDVGQPLAAPVGGVDQEARRAIEGLANAVIELRRDQGRNLSGWGIDRPSWADSVIDLIGTPGQARPRDLRDIRYTPVQPKSTVRSTDHGEAGRTEEAATAPENMAPPADSMET